VVAHVIDHDRNALHLVGGATGSAGRVEAQQKVRRPAGFGHGIDSVSAVRTRARSATSTNGYPGSGVAPFGIAVSSIAK